MTKMNPEVPPNQKHNRDHFPIQFSPPQPFPFRLLFLVDITRAALATLAFSTPGAMTLPPPPLLATLVCRLTSGGLRRSFLVESWEDKEEEVDLDNDDDGC